MKKRLRWVIPLLCVTMLIVGSAVYVQQYYPADAVALAALISDDQVQITQTNFGWHFDGPSDENALIFYPGAKVETQAYAPLCKKLAERGLDVCLMKMPLRLAFLGTNKADNVMKDLVYQHWYIGGHSLGGAMAAVYAAGHADQLDGVILLASYATKALSSDLKVALIYGSEDRVLNMKRFRECLQNVPDDAIQHVIEGGNHAQFGSYGMQSGDGQALITGDEQVEETATVIGSMLP